MAIHSSLCFCGLCVRSAETQNERSILLYIVVPVLASQIRTFLSSLALDRELRLGTLATAEVDGIDPVREFSTVRPAHTPPSRLVEAFLAYCRDALGMPSRGGGAQGATTPAGRIPG